MRSAQLQVGFDLGCWWWRHDASLAHVYVPFGTADREGLAKGVAYRLKARNGTEGFAWTFPRDLDVQR